MDQSLDTISPLCGIPSLTLSRLKTFTNSSQVWALANLLKMLAFLGPQV